MPSPYFTLYPGLREHPVAAYGATLVLLGVAAVAQRTFPEVFERAWNLPLLAGVALSAALAGRGPALVATGVAAILSAQLWPPSDGPETAALAAFAILSAALCVLIDAAVGQASRSAAARAPDLLRAETHHRLRNHLQFVVGLLVMQARSARDPDMAGRLRDAARRVGLVAEIHNQLLGAAVPTLETAAHLSQLCEQLHGALGSDLVAVTCDVAPIPLPSPALMRVALIVNELVTNAFKHGFAPGQRGEIRVSLRPQEHGRCELVVSDNGRGLPPGFTVGRDGNFGWRVIETMVADLEGVLTIEPGAGATFRVLFPCQARAGDKAADGRAADDIAA